MLEGGNKANFYALLTVLLSIASLWPPSIFGFYYTLIYCSSLDLF